MEDQLQFYLQLFYTKHFFFERITILLRRVGLQRKTWFVHCHFRTHEGNRYSGTPRPRLLDSVAGWPCCYPGCHPHLTYSLPQHRSDRHKGFTLITVEFAWEHVWLISAIPNHDTDPYNSVTGCLNVSSSFNHLKESPVFFRTFLSQNSPFYRAERTLEVKWKAHVK